MGHRSHAGCSMRYQDTHITAPLALKADTVGGDIGLSPIEKSIHHFQQLVFIRRAPAQLKIDVDMLSNGCRRTECINVLWTGIDDPDEFFDISVVAQRLNPTRSRAGTDCHKVFRRTPYQSDSLYIVRGSDRSLNKGYIIWPLYDCARSLRKVRDVDFTCYGQNLVFAIQKRQLAAVTGSELPHGHFWFLPVRHRLYLLNSE